MAFSDGYRIAEIRSLLREERTWRLHRKSVAPDPLRHFSTLNCCCAKGPMNPRASSVGFDPLAARVPNDDREIGRGRHLPVNDWP
jgi:hypothetical protein